MSKFKPVAMSLKVQVEVAAFEQLAVQRAKRTLAAVAEVCSSKAIVGIPLPSIAIEFQKPVPSATVLRMFCVVQVPGPPAWLLSHLLPFLPAQLA